MFALVYKIDTFINPTHGLQISPHRKTPDGRDLSHVADGVGNISLFIVQVSLRRWIPPPQTIDLFLGKATRRQVSAIANVKR